MIVTEIYNGQGLGNQLWCYVTTRVIAIDSGYKFGIMHPEKFKCLDFMNLDFGEKVVGGSGPEGGPAKKLPDGIYNYYKEQSIFHPIDKSDIRIFDPNLIKISDNTKIDGLMQDEKYFEHRKEEIKKWLKVRDESDCYDYAYDNICVINFRGGEYVRHKELYLEDAYWKNAVKNMRAINPNFKFVVITDDTYEAKKFFPEFEVMHFNIGKDYSIVKNAHYLILSNSSFGWFPAWLSEKLKYAIAPKYWGRHNTSDGYWSCSYNITKKFVYQDRYGRLYDYEKCIIELNEYMKEHKEYYSANLKHEHYNLAKIIMLRIKKNVGSFLSQKSKNRIYKFIGIIDEN